MRLLFSLVSRQHIGDPSIFDCQIIPNLEKKYSKLIMWKLHYVLKIQNASIKMIGIAFFYIAKSELRSIIFPLQNRPDVIEVITFEFYYPPNVQIWHSLTVLLISALNRGWPRCTYVYTQDILKVPLNSPETFSNSNHTKNIIF